MADPKETNLFDEPTKPETGNLFDLPEKPSKPEDYGPVAAFARGAVSGLTFDWADELAAMYQAGIPDYLRGDPEAQKRYEEALAQQRKVSREMKEQYPVTSFAGEVTGAVPSMFIPGMAPARGASLSARVGRGMVTGAGMGTISGAGAAEEDRLSGALTGTAVGTGLGAAAPLIPSALGGAYNRLISPVVTAFKGLKTPEEIALAKLAWAVDRDQKLIGSGKAQGLTLADWQAAKAAGEPVTLADLGAGNVQALLRSAANLSPEARDALENLAQSRFRSQYERIASDIENLITGPGDARKTRDALKAVYDRERVPAYQRAFNQPNAQVIWDNTLEQMSQAPVVQTALRGANATARSEAAKMGLAPAPNPFQWDRATNLYTIDPSKGVFPNLQFWNAVKINLDDIGGREGQFWAKKLREHLDAYVPEYKDARVGVAAKYFGERDAITAGLAAARSRIAPYELQKVMKQMKPGERAYFQDGYATGLAQDVLGEKGRNVDLTKQLFGSPQAAQRAQIVFGPQNMAKIEARLHLERIMDGARRALGNSTTARQLIEMGLAGGVTAGLMGGFDPTTVLSGAGAGVLARKAVATEAARGMKKFAGYVDGGVARKVAELLTSNDEAKINQAMQMIAKNAALREGIKAIADRVSMAALQRADNQGQKPAPRAPNPQDPMSAFTYPERRATGGSVFDKMAEARANGGRTPLRTWTSSDPVWNALNPYQKAAAMALMEADRRDPESARNALGAMINRAARGKEDLGRHVSRPIYQPSIEPTQQARLASILKTPAFQQLTGWAERRAQGYEPDPVGGATHFITKDPKTMLALEAKDPKKYRSWRNWTKYTDEAGDYQNVTMRDASHAFLSPEGKFSAPYRGSSEGAPATKYDQDAMAKLIADAEKREGMDRLVSDVTRPQNVQSLASDQEARQSLDKAVESAAGPSSAQKDQLSKYIQGLMAPQPQAPMPLIQGPPIQATPIAPVTPYDVPRAEGGSVLDRFKKKDDDDWRSNIDIPGPQDPRRQDEVRASEAPRYEELLPGRTVSALNQNPIFQAIQRFAGRSGADPSQYYISPIDGSVQPVEQKSSLLDRFSPTVREGIDKAMLAAMFLGPGAKTANLPALSQAKSMAKAGAPREQIWKETGWFQGADKKWRFEVDDSQATTAAYKPGDKLPEHLKHDPLYEAYPQFKDIEMGDPSSLRGARGTYSRGDRESGFPPRLTSKEKSTTLHEAQHAVQDVESLARGGENLGFAAFPPDGKGGAWPLYRERYKAMITPPTIESYAKSGGFETIQEAQKSYKEYVKSLNQMKKSGLPPHLERILQQSVADDYYRRLAGEVEARAVQKRMDLTPEQRQSRPPWLDYDVPEADQFFRGLPKGEKP